MSKARGPALALVAAPVVLILMAWFDTTVVHGASQQAAATFDMSQVGLVVALGMTLVAGAVLALALIAWRSRSVAVGVVYAVVGAYLALQVWIIWTFAAQINDTPPVLPEPFLSAVTNLYHATDGPLNAVGIIGAGMLVAGVAVIARSFRHRSGASAPR